MFCRSIGWLICIFVAAVAAANNSGPDSSTESSTTEPVQAFQKTPAVNLFGLLFGGNRAMVKLVAGDTELVAHRAVLAARSPVFAAMFGNGSSEYAIPDVEGPVLRHLVVYCYTLRAPHLPSMARQLLAAADKYGLPDLKANCEEQLAAQLSVENAATTAALAVKHSADSLTNASIAYIKDHLYDVMTSPGWADMIRNQPQDSTKVIQLLSGLPVPPRPPPTPETGSTSSTQLPTSSHGQTASATATPTAYSITSPTTHTRAPTTVEDSTTTTTTTTTTARPSTVHSQTPASGAPPTTPTPEDAIPTYLQGLSEVEKGRRLIKAAKKKGAINDLTLLLKAGSDLEARDSWKETALHKVARSGDVLAAGLLVKAGAQVEARNRWLETPLHVAADKGNVAVAQLLLSSSADPNAVNKLGRTPLHYAANSDDVDVAAALLDSGADKAARDVDGVTPLDLTKKSNQQLIQMLT